MLKSEGSEYNIISLSKSIDGELSVDSTTQRSLNKVRSHVIEKELRSRGESASDLTLSRALRRVSDQRRHSHLQYGYLPTDKVPSLGVSAWDRIQTSPTNRSSVVFGSERGDTKSLDARARMEEHSSMSSLSGSTFEAPRQMPPRESLAIDISKVEFGEPVGLAKQSSTRDSRRAATAGKVPLVRSSGFSKHRSED